MRLHGLRPFCVLVVAVLLTTFSAKAESRALSDVERAAVQEALEYLKSGPAPLIAHLASTSPLRKLTPAEAQQEIEVRLGPNSGATWELQTVVPALQKNTASFTISYPSGIDETALVEMTEENGALRIRDIRTLAQPSTRSPIFTAPEETAPHPVREPSVAAPLLAIIAAIVAAAGAWIRTNRVASRVAIGFALAVAATSAAMVIRENQPAPRTEAAATASTPANAYPRLAPLLPLRRALAIGDGEMPAAPCREQTCADVATIWKAQLDLQQMRTEEAKNALQRFDSPSDIPLVEMLRGRIAVLQGDDTACIIAYENAVNLGPGRDALWYEAAQALGSLGFDERAEAYFRKAARVGSRSANPYYVLSLLAAFKGRENDAEQYLETAWGLEPVERERLVRTSVWNPLLERGTTRHRINLTDPGESAVASANASTRAIALPDSARAETNGDQLRVFLGDQSLVVDGGACLAPAGTRAIDPASLAAEDEERALRDYPQLAAVCRSPGVYTNPALRLRILRTAEALANRNRWTDIAALTDGLNAQMEYVSADLFFLRAVALQRQGKRDDAHKLLRALGASKTLLRKRDARALRQLGEMLASLDDYDYAIRMLDRSQAIKANDFIDIRARQISMTKRLATKYNTYSTLHFEIHYPDDISRQAAEEIAKIFEAELSRLQEWVHVPVFRVVPVNIVWWDDFRSTMTGSDFIVGLYTGKITVPLAGIRIYEPPIVAILTHELCHAMIAQATNDQAPHWFQEGLAQLVELKPYVGNAFTGGGKRILAMSLLDAVLSDAIEPSMIEQAYDQSQMTLKYVETKYGRKGIETLIAQFRDGATTEEAVRKLSGRSVAQFDGDVRAWAMRSGPAFRNPVLIRYDEAPAEGMHWAPKRGSMP